MAVASADVIGKNVTLPLAVHIKGKVTKAGGVGLSGSEVYPVGNGCSSRNYAYRSAAGKYTVAVSPGTYTHNYSD